MKRAAAALALLCLTCLPLVAEVPDAPAPPAEATFVACPAASPLAPIGVGLPEGLEAAQNNCTAVCPNDPQISCDGAYKGDCYTSLDPQTGIMAIHCGTITLYCNAPDS